MFDFEILAALLNSHPLLWVFYGFLISAPVVIIVSYFFWPKDSVGRRKKTDDPSPDVAVKDNLSDSGIEASGEAERSPSSNGDLSPVSLLHSDTPLESDSGVNTAAPATSRLQDKPLTGDLEISVAVTESVTVEEKERRKLANGTVRSESNGEVITEQLNPTEEPDEPEEEEEEGETDAEQRWNFPPVLEDFDLMSSDVDPTQLEEIFEDKRLTELYFNIGSDNHALGISIVGGYGSPHGDLPIIIKRVLPGGLAEENGNVKAGDELVAVNETLLVGTTKDFAVEHLSQLRGPVRLLVLQDD